MSELKIFQNEEFDAVRTLIIEGNPWLVGKDVADNLGYSNSRKAIADHVDDEDKTDGVTIRDAMGREQNPVLINESGLYSLILSSKLPTAKRFKHWVTKEVLPSIRKHGMYAIDEIIENPDLGIAALQALKAEREKSRALTAQVAVQSQQIAEMQPKVSYYDICLACKDLLSITEIAKDYGWSGRKMNEWLYEQGVQFKQGNIWLLYQKYAQLGYTNTKTHVHTGKDGNPHTTVHTYWTQKGRLFIYQIMKAEGHLPTMEQDG